MPYNSQI